MKNIVRLSGVARLNTRVDVWAHAIDTLYSVRRTTASEQLSYTILDTLKNRLTNVELVELRHGGELIRGALLYCMGVLILLLETMVSLTGER